MTSPFPRPVRSAEQAAAGPRQQRTAESQPQPKPTVNKTKHGGGFNPNLGINLNFVKTGPATPAPAAAGPAAPQQGTPGSDFMSNEAIHAFCEHVRKQARNRAVERAMDAEQLEAVLRHIPTSDGSMVGARLRARRVSRHAKKIANAEQLIAKEAAALYAQFEREYEAELRKVSRARTQAQPRTAFGWH